MKRRNDLLHAVVDLGHRFLVLEAVVDDRDAVALGGVGFQILLEIEWSFCMFCGLLLVVY